MVHPKNVWVNGEAPALNADNMNNLEENAYNGALFAENYTDPTWTQVTGKPSTFAPIIGTTATTAKAGNWNPPEATSVLFGTVKLASNTVQEIWAEPITQNSSRSYSVQRANTGALVVNVPWVNTTYVEPTPTLRGVVFKGVAVANATDEASAITQLNALLASLRASGSIAT